MPSRKKPLIEGEYYHIYNRGVEKINIVSDQKDMDRFFQSMEEFNTIDPIGSIYEHSFVKKNQLGSPTSKLIEIVAYCLNPNHYHFILKQVSEKGIEKFMQRFGTGYTKYFNNRHERSGALFQGVFKSIHVNTDPYFMHLSAYVNLNNRVHKLGSRTSKLSMSSWSEYVGESKRAVCKKDFIMGYFKSTQDYKRFAIKSIEETISRRRKEKEWKDLFLE